MKRLAKIVGVALAIGVVISVVGAFVGEPEPNRQVSGTVLATGTVKETAQPYVILRVGDQRLRALFDPDLPPAVRPDDVVTVSCQDLAGELWHCSVVSRTEPLRGK